MGFLQHQLIDFRINRFANRRKRAFDQHVCMLSHEEQQQLAEGTHPSQSHARDKAAQPFAEALQRQFHDKGWPCTVTVGYYHLDRVILSVDLAQSPRNPKLLPWFFHGFEIVYNWPGAAG